MGIHPTAIVADSAVLADDVEIGPYCTVGPEVRLGARTRLHGHVVVDGDTWIGEDCELYPFAVIGCHPQDKKLKAGDRAGRLRIGNHNRIREHVTVHGGTAFGGGETVIGDHNMLLVGSHIGHDATVGNHVVFTNGAMAAGHTWIGDRAILGAMVGIHQFARVGKLAMIGAGAMVSHDAPPFAMIQGDRAKLVAVNLVGMHRNGYTAEQKALVKRVFRLLFWRTGTTLNQRLELLRTSTLNRDPVCTEIVDFISESKRGVCSPRAGRHHKLADADLSESGPDGERNESFRRRSDRGESGDDAASA
ncbi:MAG: acyl-ACP--UDP-N-acetylglucosamine O-acyltransferase [Planctomycetes bacterium]|nr:acyl-ACP--UDP-N-acetylglucosamine O-acyltransferase [Planctomycetota bacterium]